MKRIQAFVLCISAMAVLSAIHLGAQTSESDLLSELGAPAGTTTWPFPGGFVNLKNGNFHITIPIETLKQRNGRNVTMSLIYDSQFYDNLLVDGIGYIVNALPASEFGEGWRYVFAEGDVNLADTALSYSGTLLVTGCSLPTPGCPTIRSYTWSNWTYTDASGAAHDLGGTTFQWGICPNAWASGIFSCPTDPSLPPDIPTSISFAGDGSGYSLSVTNYDNAIAYDQHGNIVANSGGLPADGGLPTDTNGNEIWNFPPNGSSLPNGFSIHTSDISVGVTDGYAGGFPVVNSITLPDGRQYTFTYDEGGYGHNGIMTSMTLPTGGTIAFQSQVFTASYYIPVTQITTPDGVTTFNWYPSCNISGNTSVFPACGVTIIAPNQSQTTYQNIQYVGTGNCTSSTGSTSTLATYAGAATGTPLRSVTEQFDQCGRATSVTTTQDGLSQETAYTYSNIPELNVPNGLPTNLITSKVEYDFVGGIARETDAVYNTGTQYLSRYIEDLPSSVTVYGAGGSSSGPLLAQTNYSYDQYPLSTTSGSAGTTIPISAIQGYNAAYATQTIRGNLTGVSQMVAPGQFIPAKTNYYNVLGEVVESVDGDGHQTSYDYSDKWADSTCVSGLYFAYPTTVTNALGKFSTSTYNSCDGSVHSVQDQNGQATTYGYDNMQRLISTTYPDGGQTTTNYGDPAIPEVVTATTLAAPSPTEISTTKLDGLGRTQESVAATGAITDTAYNSMGWVASVSNPYYSSAGPSGYTTYAYDALGRKLVQCQPDNGNGSEPCVAPQPACPSCLQWAYSGSTTTSTDENKNSTQGTTDALGRLWKVVEPGALTTYYHYDALNNLLTVSQLGNRSTDTARSRSFTYDGLSRLICASNPENSTEPCPTSSTGAYVTGTTGYTYDNNGNVHTKTDARGVTVTYNYDALNRISSKSYSDGVTPVSCYQYDSSSVANGIGRLANEWTQSASAYSCTASTAPWTKRSILAYDPMGRILYEQQCTPSNCTNGTPYAPAYTYDLAGNLLTSTSGVGPTSPIIFSNSYNSGGQLLSLSSSWNNNGVFPTQLFSSPTYAAFGGLSNATIGSGLTQTRQYDLNRLWITSEADTGAGSATATSGSATVTITGSEQTQ